MARYVDGDALIKWARERSLAQGVEGKVLCFDFETAVRKYEVVDVEPKSEGEWRSELVKKCDWKGKKQQYYQPNSCSLCHEAVLKRTSYCPNCGARMKGGAE